MDIDKMNIELCQVPVMTQRDRLYGATKACVLTHSSLTRSPSQDLNKFKIELEGIFFVCLNCREKKFVLKQSIDIIEAFFSHIYIWGNKSIRKSLQTY